MYSKALHVFFLFVLFLYNILLYICIRFFQGCLASPVYIGRKAITVFPQIISSLHLRRYEVFKHMYEPLSEDGTTYRSITGLDVVMFFGGKECPFNKVMRWDSKWAYKIVSRLETKYNDPLPGTQPNNFSTPK